ncbi:hypothetical protein MPSEU_000477400 [Mayamaea pseudoterrestris]|nr:hypothetical protein MPSEU_000477400 [Mayamaea pseudoterrestris]
MSFRPDNRPPVQDMPPRGGFPSINLNLRKGNRGPSGAVIWGVATTAIAFGFYRVCQYNKQMNGEKLEERRARYAMAPILQAEEDRWYVERENGILKHEAEIMKDVRGWTVGESTYHSDRWVNRQVAQLNKNLK